MKNVLKNVEADKNIMKNIQKLNYYETKNFVDDAQAYIKAIKERRMLCVIKKVSSSGMSRNIKFNSCEKRKNNYNYRQYICLFKALGYTEVKQTDSFRIGGCGMDMIFHTNYSIIHVLKRLGFLTKEECAELAQMTPTVL